MAYFPYVTLLSVISFNDVTIPAFSTLLNELNASLPQCCLEYGGGKQVCFTKP